MPGNANTTPHPRHNFVGGATPLFSRLRPAPFSRPTTTRRRSRLPLPPAAERRRTMAQRHNGLPGPTPCLSQPYIIAQIERGLILHGPTHLFMHAAGSSSAGNAISFWPPSKLSTLRRDLVGGAIFALSTAQHNRVRLHLSYIAPLCAVSRHIPPSAADGVFCNRYIERSDLARPRDAHIQTIAASAAVAARCLHQLLTPTKADRSTPSLDTSLHI